MESAQEICCVEEKIANIRGVVVQWRGRRHCGGGADDVTQELRVIQARLEAIETIQKRGVAVEALMRRVMKNWKLRTHNKKLRQLKAQKRGLLRT